MKATIPKVKFKVAKPREIIPLINYFVNPKKSDWDWSNQIFNKYPELKKKLSKVKDKERRKKITKVFFEKQQKKELKTLNNVREKFQKAWDEINDEVMIALSEIVGQKWPKNAEKITARISLNPICLRYIKSRTFDIYYKSSIDTLKAISIHEIFHFIYFEKWKKLFPKTPEKKFNFPYLVWALSEMVPPIVLSNEKIQKIHEHKSHPYQEHVKMEVDGKCIFIDLIEFYKKRKSFDDFLRKSWKFLNKHNDVVKGKL